MRYILSNNANFCSIRKIYLFALLILAVSGIIISGCTQTSVLPRTEATDIAEKAYTAMSSLDWETFSELLHPDALAEFKNMIYPVVAASIPRTDSGFVRDSVPIFGSLMSISTMEQADGITFFNNVMNAAFDNTPQLQQTFSSIRSTVVGELPEGDNIVHVLTRTTLTIGKDINEMSVMSIEKIDGEPKLHLPPRIKGLAQLIAQSFRMPGR